ncbi:MAG: hypothetical protein JJU45_04935 [Acidimicrobiia bacterium]|nr:hypothetical protein [Acidimicrobiia bacterium]
MDPTGNDEPMEESTGDAVNEAMAGVRDDEPVRGGRPHGGPLPADDETHSGVNEAMGGLAEDD